MFSENAELLKTVKQPANSCDFFIYPDIDRGRDRYCITVYPYGCDTLEKLESFECPGSAHVLNSGIIRLRMYDGGRLAQVRTLNMKRFDNKKSGGHRYITITVDYKHDSSTDYDNGFLKLARCKNATRGKLYVDYARRTAPGFSAVRERLSEKYHYESVWTDNSELLDSKYVSGTFLTVTVDI